MRDVPVTDRSLIQGSTTKCVCVCVCVSESVRVIKWKDNPPRYNEYGKEVSKRKKERKKERKCAWHKTSSDILVESTRPSATSHIELATCQQAVRGTAGEGLSE